jgi:nucleoside-diphosphate-sugar epimerase
MFFKMLALFALVPFLCMVVQLQANAFSLSATTAAAAVGSCKTGTIAVFGGTGLLGRECVFQALKANQKVIVLARDPAKMLVPSGSGGDKADQPLTDERLTVVTGDVNDQQAVNKVFQAADDIHGVIVALGGRTKNVGPTMLTDGTRNIIEAMKKFSSAKRIAVVTSIGTGDSEKQAPWSFRALMYTVMRKTFADKNNQEGLFLSPNGPGHDLE